MKKSYYTFTMDDDENNIVEFESPSLAEFLGQVAMEECMSDCSGVNITKIVYEGHEWRWVGWLPDMEYTFVRVDDPKLEWSVWLPHMEH